MLERLTKIVTEKNYSEDKVISFVLFLRQNFGHSTDENGLKLLVLLTVLHI